MDDFSQRILCSDGNCIGIINEQGFCNICGKPLRGKQEKGEEEENDSDFYERILCSDGNCVGIINEKGFCNVCGKRLKEEKNKGERWEKEDWEKKREKRDKENKDAGNEKSLRYFEILGIRPGVSDEELKQVYRDLVNVWHPDRFVGNPRLQKKAEENIKEINAAYEYIKSFYCKT
jgi:hypothetical protein